MNEIKLDSSAKVNLFLELLHKRDDGYFQIETVLQEIDLQDTISIKDKEGGKIKVEVSPSLNIPQEENIAYKAAILIQKKGRKLDNGAEIFIKKKIPVGRGLGGGSSNAAAVLKGLNRLWGLGFSSEELADFGKELGMDVPFFIYGGTCLGTERGEVITPLPSFANLKILVFWPDFTISTAQIYKNASFCLPTADRQKGLTKKIRSVKLLTEALNTNDFEGVKRNFFNRLENVAFKIHPLLYQFKEKIKSLNEISNNIVMSGSGSAFFAILPDKGIDEEHIKKEIIKLKGGYHIGKTLPAF
ncbi:MAG: 4-(cytidine 5'-diphospho)-2-C-methyl-D-erythritol kinase [Candidatus Ratteibacteria bacterium]|nr:4-(cytidine 5'-diphospho)-2-C-methyl-D-erythritol kinase [Candidatus Ratteibacteria bacterium]